MRRYHHPHDAGRAPCGRFPSSVGLTTFRLRIRRLIHQAGDPERVDRWVPATIQTILNAIERDIGGVAVVWCPDFELREWLVGEVSSVADPDSHPVRATNVEEALVDPSRLVLLVPNDERQAVLDLDGSRDRIIDAERTQPIALFLLRDGDGQQALAKDAMSLASWVSGSDADPERIAEVDLAAERTSFERQHRITPEQWLGKWRHGELPQTSDNFQIAYHAMLLEWQ